MFSFIEQNPFAAIASVNRGMAQLTRLPLLLADDQKTLYGHMPKSYPEWRNMPGIVIASFQGPYEAFVSDNWYVKPNGISTWNFVDVRVTGPVQFHGTPEETLEILRKTSRKLEERIGSTEPWTVDKIPEDYRNNLLKHIGGFSIAIETVRGYFKLDQQQPIADQKAVISSLRKQGGYGSMAIADLLEQNPRKV